ncbi:hypothetical protein SAMN02799631_01949 [Methylobacterium sp. 174MFSha1.1]|uniref:hypothetical protein n=1 Tax=Methylobacterium sp. 174MFSha1.1 TaxID=1502749 RepID=UPI0008E99551|nr:hypothetical protein [Methylobacterium sp. 174MFSha1.1]SFU71896.1 hypothetical protein SAMN02799631_01949 [Methylobacterium sp. 174MFSha1.1]
MLDSDHLLDQAERLLAPVGGSEPSRLTDLCRAVSATYYAVFHAGLIAAADLFAETTERGTLVYGLAYRSIEHAKMKALCQEVLKSAPSARYHRYVPAGGWDRSIADYARIFITLNERRMLADYDPAYVVSESEVEVYVRLARSAIAHLDSADEVSKRMFLTLLLFPPR